MARSSVDDPFGEGSCVFCARLEAGDAVRSEHAAAFFDAYPVSPGHSLIVPLRHEPDVFKLHEREQRAIWKLLAERRLELQRNLGPAGFNVGVNNGLAAGQTVGHAHVHLIPRFEGDVADPRGGVRWVLPDRAVYWEQ